MFMSNIFNQKVYLFLIVIDQTYSIQKDIETAD